MKTVPLFAYSALNGDMETAYSIGDIRERKKPASGTGSSARESSALNGGRLSEVNVAQNGGDVKMQSSVRHCFDSGTLIQDGITNTKKRQKMLGS